jgi:fibronectin type 3 domain-containing protein
MDFLDDGARDLLKGAGADVRADSPRVRFDPAMVEERIRTAPSTFTLHGPNPEHDIVGYQVYRRLTSGGTATLVCSLTQQTSCQDQSPPNQPTLYYYVVALDRDATGAQRLGALGDDVTVTQTDHPPFAPTNLLASTSNGTTILRWTAASPADPDAGDSIAFYRIYRDGSAYANRYDRTGTGADVTYTDTHPDGVSHTYYVTAVDTQLAESPLLGPVTK